MVLRFCVAFLRNFSVHGVVLLVFTDWESKKVFSPKLASGRPGVTSSTNHTVWVFLRQKGLVQQGRGHCTTNILRVSVFSSHMELEWEGSYLHSVNGHEDIIIIRDLRGKQKRMGTQ
ncbi:hypothetical protein QR685DRAFT_579150 [Neurospora intermedia]|uniref:Secreted protein n=1 Tax=Neurospora intermedia TaxID=5142 RepID=A0ABR3DTT0_NEUIN